MSKSPHLQALHKATNLSTEILQALKSGDSKLANSIAEDRYAIIQNIDFAELTQQYPDIAPIALAQFETANNRLIKTTTEIKDTVAEEINKVQKSLAGAKAYSEISKQLDPKLL